MTRKGGGGGRRGEGQRKLPAGWSRKWRVRVVSGCGNGVYRWGGVCVAVASLTI